MGLTVSVENQEHFVVTAPNGSPVINDLNPLNDQFEETPLEEIQEPPTEVLHEALHQFHADHEEEKKGAA